MTTRPTTCLAPQMMACRSHDVMLCLGEKGAAHQFLVADENADRPVNPWEGLSEHVSSLGAYQPIMMHYTNYTSYPSDNPSHEFTGRSPFSSAIIN